MSPPPPSPAAPVELSGGADPGQVRTALRVLGALARPEAPLGVLTTYRVGGRAAVGVEARSAGDLEVVAEAVGASGLPVLAVGRGSNLLVADRGFGGIAVTLAGDPESFGAIDLGPAGTDRRVVRLVRAGAAVALPTLARRSADAGLNGLEWAVGVPGSVGGGVRMNAGGHGSDIATSLQRAWLIDLARANQGVYPVDAEDLGYRYRHSRVSSTQVVLAAEFGLRAGDREASRAAIRQIVRWRREHQPGGQNAGSVFTNPSELPPADSAGWLIETAGVKGRQIGQAIVSPKHANFIQAEPGGSADDVFTLIELVKGEVERVTGVVLRTEVRMIGFPVHRVSMLSGGLG